MTTANRIAEFATRLYERPQPECSRTEYIFQACSGAPRFHLFDNDGNPSRISHNDCTPSATTVRGIAGTSQRYLEDAVISFRDSLGTPVFRYRVTVRIGKPDDVDLRLPSLLGQDLLTNWRTIHEPALQRLEFIPKTSDIVDE